METNENDSYKRFTTHPKCKCGCPTHCGHSCTECDYCPDCECEKCLTGLGYN